MMPDQSQGACMAVEDAACLGIVFSKKYFRGDVAEALATYEFVRKPRATRVQAAAAKARENINERIGRILSMLQGEFDELIRTSLGFSSNTDSAAYKAAVPKEDDKLTIEEMNS